MGTPACTHCLAMGHQLRGWGCISQQDTHVLMLLIALGVSFHPSTQTDCSCSAQGPEQDTVLEQQRQWHPVLSPREGASHASVLGRRWLPALLKAQQLRFAKF